MAKKQNKRARKKTLVISKHLSEKIKASLSMRTHSELQADHAKYLGIGIATYSNILNGITQPDLSVIMKLRKSGVSYEEIFFNLVPKKSK